MQNSRSEATRPPRVSSRNDRSSESRSAAAESIFSRSPTWLIAATATLAAAILLPTFFVPLEYDAFRTPKMLLLRLLAVVSLFGFLAFATRRDWREILTQRAGAMTLTASFVAWAFVSAIVATRPLTAFNALVNVLAGAVLVVSTLYVSRRAGLILLDAVAIAAALNSVIYLAQFFAGWDPFGNESLGAFSHVALLGNRNDLGSYLLAVAVAASAVAATTRRMRRVIYSCLALLLIATVLLTQTRAAIIPLVVALPLMVIIRWRKRGAIAVAAIGCVAIALFFFSGRWASVQRSPVWHSWEARNLALSGRLPAFAAAWEMFRDHPVTGVGPGCFEPLYFQYRLAVDLEYPEIAIWRVEKLGYPVVFSETHNDHLQILAELGVVGYLLFLTALLYVGWHTFRRGARPATDPRALMAAPLSTAAAIVTLAGFPFQVAAPAATYLLLAAICVSSGEERAGA